MTIAVGTDAVVTEIIEALGFEVKHLRSVTIEFRSNAFVVATVERHAELEELDEVLEVVKKYDITATPRE